MDPVQNVQSGNSATVDGGHALNGVGQFVATLEHAGFSGETDGGEETLEFYSHDASLFELKPQVVVFPKNTKDIEILVNTINECRKYMPSLSVTARSAGTDMSGGAISESIVVDFNKYFRDIEATSASAAHVQPGVFYRDFDKATLKHGSILPSYPASRELATVGGMVANNSGGEKSLQYGKTEDYVKQLEVVLSDGKSYTLKPLNKTELAAKKKLKSLEGKIYREMFELLDKNYDKIKAAKPHVSKNSTGYNLWDVWDRDRGIFDLTKLVVGSQGTLGLVTDIHFKLVPSPKHSGLLVAFLKDVDKLGEIINLVLTHKPTSFEGFDDNTLWLSIKFFPFFRKTLGWKGLAQLALSLLPDGLMLLKGVPKLVLMIEFTGQTEEEVAEKIHAMKQTLKPYKMAMEEDETEAKSKKFWIIRREAFNLLRKKVHEKHTAPFIDDLVVPPPRLPEFLPKLRRIVKKYRLLATIQGHIGDGNFHIIPLMKIEERDERAKLRPAMKEVNELVLKYGGSLSGEHNDGMIRGPWLETMYGKEVTGLFRQTKQIFDPENIFNPHKKTDATWDYSMSHIRQHF
jgi:FAD/FMN-containing dehydrogenase